MLPFLLAAGSPTYVQPFDLSGLSTAIQVWTRGTFSIVLPIAALFIGAKLVFKAFNYGSGAPADKPIRTFGDPELSAEQWDDAVSDREPVEGSLHDHWDTLPDRVFFTRDDSL